VGVKNLPVKWGYLAETGSGVGGIRYPRKTEPPQLVTKKTSLLHATKGKIAKFSKGGNQ